MWDWKEGGRVKGRSRRQEAKRVDENQSLLSLAHVKS